MILCCGDGVTEVRSRFYQYVQPELLAVFPYRCMLNLRRRWDRASLALPLEDFVPAPQVRPQRIQGRAQKGFLYKLPESQHGFDMVSLLT